MKTIRIFTYALIPVILLIGYLLYRSILQPVERARYIERVENRVKDKLKMIETLQIAYLNEYGEYAGKPEELKEFVRNGQITLTQRVERIVGKSKINPRVDSVEVRIDTLGQVSVQDSIWSKYDYQVENLATIPGSQANKEFEFYADVIEKKKSGVRIPVMEVKDTDPVDLQRLSDDHPRGPLKIGSRDEPITSGNWK